MPMAVRLFGQRHGHRVAHDKHFGHALRCRRRQQPCGEHILHKKLVCTCWVSPHIVTVGSAGDVSAPEHVRQPSVPSWVLRPCGMCCSPLHPFDVQHMNGLKHLAHRAVGVQQRGQPRGAASAGAHHPTHRLGRTPKWLRHHSGAQPCFMCPFLKRHRAANSLLSTAHARFRCHSLLPTRRQLRKNVGRFERADLSRLRRGVGGRRQHPPLGSAH